MKARLPQRSPFGTLRLALGVADKAGRSVLAGILAATVVTSVAIAIQLLVGREILNLLADQDTVSGGELAPWLIALGALLLVSALSQAMTTELRFVLAERVHRHTIRDVLDVAGEVELEAFDDPEFHDRLQRARLAAATQSSAVVFGLVTILSTTIIAVGVIAVLLSVAPILAPVAVAGYVPIALVNVRNNRERYELERSLTELERDRYYLEHLLSDRDEAKEIRSYRTAPTIRGWYEGLWEIRLTKIYALVRRRLALTTLASAVSTAVLIGTLSFALILAGRGSISLGDAAVAIVSLQQLSTRLRSAGTAFSGVHEGITFFRDFEQFRASLPEIRAARPTGVPPSPPARIGVDGLGYRYPGADVDALRTVSFEIEHGQTVAIVGANGSGKSTLAKLLCGLLPPTRGVIRWDDVDTGDCDPELLRAQIAPVFQDYSRLMLTFRQTIGLGDADRLDDEAAIRAAIEAVDLTDVVDASTDGLDTRLGKPFVDGTDVSIGQWQRLAIGRALFRDAPILILDEPSASLDPQAEADLFDLLHAMGEGRTVIFISHRFATVRDADVVLVMDNGEIVERGDHSSLMAEGGLYSDLYAIQADRYGLTP